MGARRNKDDRNIDHNGHHDEGANAEAPIKLSRRAWFVILKRVWVNSGRHNIGLMSAGVAFYAFLSFVPLLGALVMSYGLVADPTIVARHMKMIIDLVPADAAQLIYEQLTNLTNSAPDKKGLGLIVALGVSIYGATRASGALIMALNVIYEEEDTRGIVRGTGLSAALIIGAIFIGIFGVLSASMLGYAQQLIGGAGPVGALVIRVVTWAAAGTLCCFTIGAMYRFAPDRSDARWEWLSVGAAFATALWLLATLAFGYYAARFADYDATYGSLGAVVVLLMWLYVSAYAILLGAMMNAEAERQTACDTTTGSERPMGSRGAAMADQSAALTSVEAGSGQ